MIWLWLLGLPSGVVILLLAALGLLMAAQRAKAWWTSRGEADEPGPAEELSTAELWEAIEAALADRKVVRRRFNALMKAQKMPLYRRIPGLRPRLGTGRRTS